MKIATAIVVLVSIVICTVCVSVAVSRKNKVSGQPVYDRGRRYTPEEIREANGYNFWIRPSENGGRAYYYGAHCNAIGVACSQCGVFEVQIDTNEVIGACSECNVCSGGAFEADCTNIATGKFNCAYLDEEPQIPGGYDYNIWMCPYTEGKRSVCAGFTDCNLVGICSKCGVYELNVDTNEIIGECSSCNVCASGGFEADCSNIGYGKFNCYFPEDE